MSFLLEDLPIVFDPSEMESGQSGKMPKNETSSLSAELISQYEETHSTGRRMLVLVCLLASRHDPGAAKFAREALASLDTPDRARVLLATALLEDSGLVGSLERESGDFTPTIPNPATFHDPQRLAALVGACDPVGHSFRNEKDMESLQTCAHEALASTGIRYTLRGSTGICITREPLIASLAEAWSMAPPTSRRLFIPRIVPPCLLREAQAQPVLGSDWDCDIMRPAALLLLALSLFLGTGLVLGHSMTAGGPNGLMHK